MSFKVDRRLAAVLMLLMVAGLWTGLYAEGHLQETPPQAAPTVVLPVAEEGFGGDVPPGDDIPPYDGTAYVPVHGNVPYFTQEELTDQSFERYSELDALGRCGAACASIGQDLMPTEPREPIGSVRPSGWRTVRYDGVVDGAYLYNRCHLIGFRLTGENANPQNLITGTRYLNIEGMRGVEGRVADYVSGTGNHVLYRVTPVFQGENLVADGVLIEGRSVEDGGAGICFCVFAYNIQPGVEIDYATGESKLTPEGERALRREYIVDEGEGAFHLTDCPAVRSVEPERRRDFTGTRAQLEEEGYAPCVRCLP